MLIHVGHIVENEFRRIQAINSRCTVTWLATRINCDRRNVHDIFNRHSLDTAMLMKLSDALDHNFFADIAELYAELRPGSF